MCVGMSVCMCSTRACPYDVNSVAEAHLDLCVALIAVHSTLHAHDTLAGQLAEHQPTLVAHHCNTAESITRVYIITANLDRFDRGAYCSRGEYYVKPHALYDGKDTYNIHVHVHAHPEILWLIYQLM